MLLLSLMICTACGAIDIETYHLFVNDSDKDVFYILDFLPTDKMLSPGFLDGSFCKAKEDDMILDMYFCPIDSLHVYIMDPELIPKSSIYKGSKELIDAIPEEAFWARLTYSAKSYHKREELSYPPGSNCMTVIYYREF